MRMSGGWSAWCCNPGSKRRRRNTSGLAGTVGFFAESGAGAHTLRGNKARGYTAGIFMNTDATHLLDNNTVTKNAFGLLLGSVTTGVNVVNNKASNNLSVGILNQGMSVAIFGNTARNNPDADYCGPTPPGINTNNFGTIVDPC